MFALSLVAGSLDRPAGGINDCFGTYTWNTERIERGWHFHQKLMEIRQRTRSRIRNDFASMHVFQLWKSAWSNNHNGCIVPQWSFSFSEAQTRVCCDGIGLCIDRPPTNRRCSFDVIVCSLLRMESFELCYDMSILNKRETFFSVHYIYLIRFLYPETTTHVLFFSSL